MGGKLWQDEEEEMFWEHCMPFGPKRLNIHKLQHGGEERSWEDLAKLMHERFGTRYRKYTFLSMFEHFFQNVMKERISPNSRGRAEAYIRQCDLEGHPRTDTGFNRPGKRNAQENAEDEDEPDYGDENEQGEQQPPAARNTRSSGPAKKQNKKPPKNGEPATKKQRGRRTGPMVLSDLDPNNEEHQGIIEQTIARQQPSQEAVNSPLHAETYAPLIMDNPHLRRIYERRQQLGLPALFPGRGTLGQGERVGNHVRDHPVGLARPSRPADNTWFPNQPRGFVFGSDGSDAMETEEGPAGDAAPNLAQGPAHVNNAPMHNNVPAGQGASGVVTNGHDGLDSLPRDFARVLPSNPRVDELRRGPTGSPRPNNQAAQRLPDVFGSSGLPGGLQRPLSFLDIMGLPDPIDAPMPAPPVRPNQMEPLGPWLPPRQETVPGLTRGGQPVPAQPQQATFASLGGQGFSSFHPDPRVLGYQPPQAPHNPSLYRDEDDEEEEEDCLFVPQGRRRRFH